MAFHVGRSSYLDGLWLEGGHGAEVEQVGGFRLVTAMPHLLRNDFGRRLYANRAAIAERPSRVDRRLLLV